MAILETVALDAKWWWKHSKWYLGKPWAVFLLGSFIFNLTVGDTVWWDLLAFGNLLMFYLFFMRFARRTDELLDEDWSGYPNTEFDMIAAVWPQFAWGAPAQKIAKGPHTLRTAQDQLLIWNV